MQEVHEMTEYFISIYSVDIYEVLLKCHLFCKVLQGVVCLDT